MIEGQKFSKDKLPWWTVIFSQIPNAIEEIVRCSNAGHIKYPGDSDWKNFERVKDGQNQYKNAAIRHIKESENHVFNKDMAEYDPKVRHLAQAAWNLLILMELQIRDEKIKEVPFTDSEGYYIKPISEVMQNIGEMAQETHDKIQEYKDTPEQESIPKWMTEWDKPINLGDKINHLVLFDRPTLSVDKLLDREDYHPDQEI